MRISDWSSDVCSSDLVREVSRRFGDWDLQSTVLRSAVQAGARRLRWDDIPLYIADRRRDVPPILELPQTRAERSEEHTSELQSLMRISYAVFCLKQKTNNYNNITMHSHNNIANNTLLSTEAQKHT